jgi:long-chain acyl-CoA synthetase
VAKVPAVQAERLYRGLLAYCKERMAAYKYPRVIEFRDELPKNALGKILKAELIPG